MGASAPPGCWMASHLWTAARRYINHSCAPNCVAEVVTFERGHKIIISSSRRIQKGEEVSSAPTHRGSAAGGALLAPPAPPVCAPPFYKGRLRGADGPAGASGPGVTLGLWAAIPGGRGSQLHVCTLNQHPLPGFLESLAAPLVVPSLRLACRP